MDWNSIEGLSSMIRNANWGIAFTVLFTFVFTVVVIVADKKREKLSRDEDTKKEGRIEELRQKNLELQKSLTPRDLSAVDPANKEKFDALLAKMNALKAFAGTEVTLEVVPDFEARRAARYVASIIQQAGWKITSEQSSEAINDGITIWRHAPIKPDFSRGPDEIRAEQSANALVDCLTSVGWQKVEMETGSVALEGPSYIPPNKVIIQVGFKPNLIFEPEWVKKMRKQEEEIKNKIKNQ